MGNGNLEEKYCKWCGREPATGEHHLFRRGVSPQLVDDPRNKVKLGALCHKYATENREVEELFQQYFFLKPEVEGLSVEYIANFMKNEPVISPRDISRFRNYLSGEFFFQNNRFVGLERRKPFKVEEFKNQEGVKSEARAERMYEMTEDGISYFELQRLLKVMEKMLSSLRTAFEQYVKEGQNIF